MSAALRARILLEEARVLGVDLADLQRAARDRPTIPTVADYVAMIEPTFTAATARTYRPYWRLAVAHIGEAPLTSVTVEDLVALVQAATDRARTTRPDSTGRASTETCVAAFRAVFRRAVASGITSSNPAAALTKPSRRRSRRRALDDRELVDLIDAVRTTSHDPDLDLLLIRFHLETGARRQGALGLRRVDIDPHRSTIWLREKNDGEREQPASPTLTQQLIAFAAARGSTIDQTFRSRDGRPITGRRYDTLFTRARTVLDWAGRPPVSAHVLRHTAITAIARIAGYPVAQAFAGHAAPGVTGRYLHAGLAEVAAAVAVMTGEPHPLAPAAVRCQRR